MCAAVLETATIKTLRLSVTPKVPVCFWSHFHLDLASASSRASCHNSCLSTVPHKCYHQQINCYQHSLPGAGEAAQWSEPLQSSQVHVSTTHTQSKSNSLELQLQGIRCPSLTSTGTCTLHVWTHAHTTKRVTHFKKFFLILIGIASKDSVWCRLPHLCAWLLVVVFFYF